MNHWQLIIFIIINSVNIPLVVSLLLKVIFCTKQIPADSVIMKIGLGIARIAYYSSCWFLPKPQLNLGQFILPRKIYISSFFFAVNLCPNPLTSLYHWSPKVLLAESFLSFVLLYKCRCFPPETLCTPLSTILTSLQAFLKSLCDHMFLGLLVVHFCTQNLTVFQLTQTSSNKINSPHLSQLCKTH